MLTICFEQLKRRMGVRGTAGTTPAPAKVASRRESFAPSSATSTPFIRPGSAMSTASETPSVTTGRMGALATSKRVNGAVPSTVTKGPAAVKRATGAPLMRASQAQAQAAVATVRTTGSGARTTTSSEAKSSRRVSFLDASPDGASPPVSRSGITAATQSQRRRMSVSSVSGMSDSGEGKENTTQLGASTASTSSNARTPVPNRVANAAKTGTATAATKAARRASIIPA